MSLAVTQDDLAFATIAELQAAMAARRLSAREYVEHCLTRIARCDDTARAFIEVTGEAALAAAEAADARRARDATVSPLCGIPFCVKDLIDIAGLRTTAGSRVLADNVAAENASVVERMFQAGAVSLGKANLHEFAYGATGENPLTGTCVNAYDLTRLAGGSSSGSAAAVAFGMVPAAFATDTGGSTRVPAALSGLVGLKPTLGRISTRGVLPYCWSLDHVGLITRSVLDCALLLEAVAGWDPRDPASADEPVERYSETLRGDVTGLRVGIPRAFYYERCDPDILAACERVLRHLEAQGASLVEVELPAMEQARTVSLTLQMPEALSFHARYLEERGDLYGEDLRAGLAFGQFILAEHYVRARRMLTLYREGTNAAFADVDILVTPATPVTAPKLSTSHVEIDGVREPAGNALTRYTTFFNMSGHPALTVPSGLSGDGLPMGVQLIARHFEESILFRAAAAIEAAVGFALPPPLL